MCEHYDNTNKTIKILVQKLYPSIQHQFILIGPCNECVSTNPDNPNAILYHLLNKLKNEFQSLVTYEIKLVFPSVIKVFDKKGMDKNSPLPSIAELIQLTKSKEQKILQLVNKVDAEILMMDLTDINFAINKLIRIFLNDFIIERNKWNKMIQERLNSCSCFIKSVELKP
jgi:hypothetical protein